jgi:hypothetical protein
MWIDEIDVAQRLEALERTFAATDPELVLSFAALAHPSLRARFLVTLAAEDPSSEASSSGKCATSALGRYSALLAFWLLLSLSILLGSIVPIISAAVLVGATLGLCGLLATMAVILPRMFDGAGASPIRRGRNC